MSGRAYGNRMRPRQLTVPCIKCGAKPGQPCRSRRGRTLPWGQAHDARLDAVNASAWERARYTVR
jgi:hypothetical protein